MTIINNLSGRQAPQAPQFTRQMQRLYDRYDLLCDACHNVRWAAEALTQCRDADQAQVLSALEDIGFALARDRDAAHARLEQLEAQEQADLRRVAMD